MSTITDQEQDACNALRLGGSGAFVALIQGVIGAGDEHFAPFQQSRGEKSQDRAKDDFLEKGGVHGRLYEAEAVPPGCAWALPWKSQTPKYRIRTPSLRVAIPLIFRMLKLTWDLGSAPAVRLYQKPHWRVAMIQAPRRRFVTACAITQEARLRVRYATKL